MRVFAKTGNKDIATVYLGRLPGGEVVEFVESLQPPIPRKDKWVLIVSTLFGCPVRCRFCDSGSYYRGRLNKHEILSQIDFMITRRFSDKILPVKKFKIQFSRMGEPSFNKAVIDVLEELPFRYQAPGILPVVSTIAPESTDLFFTRLLGVQRKIYRGNFQLQFSVHSTDKKQRDWLMPVKKWGLEEISRYGEEFYQKGGRKITLNFALSTETIIDPDVLRQYFSPDIFLVKITPVNPTYQSESYGIVSFITPEKTWDDVIDRLKEVGYEVILSIGEWEENNIGSNCGQLVTRYLQEKGRKNCFSRKST